MNYGRMWVTRFLRSMSYLSLLLLIFPGIYWLSRWSMNEINVVDEGTIGTDAFKRSWAMTRGKAWSVFKAFFAGFLIFVAIISAIRGVEFIISSGSEPGFIPESEMWLLNGVFSMLCSLFVPPWLLYNCGVYAQLNKREVLSDVSNK